MATTEMMNHDAEPQVMYNNFVSPDTPTSCKGKTPLGKFKR